GGGGGGGGAGDGATRGGARPGAARARGGGRRGGGLPPPPPAGTLLACFPRLRFRPATTARPTAATLASSRDDGSGTVAAGSGLESRIVTSSRKVWLAPLTPKMLKPVKLLPGASMLVTLNCWKLVDGKMVNSLEVLSL